MKTQTAQPSSLISCSYLPSRWRYDVFLSFYGKDTRKNFIAHLYTALKNKGIVAFIDDEKLERGRYISPNLLQAIEESRYAIVVLSQNYASSRWCLLELVKIVECMEKTGLKIFPIFYHVNPCHVRHQTNCFAETFAELKKDSEIVQEDVQTWKAALQKVGNISGWNLLDVNESTAIQGIVRLILSELNSRVSKVSKDLIGLVTRVEELQNLCFNDRPGDDVRFVGIWGMGGIGKTALARAFYDRFSSKFEASCFIANVRERTGKDGLNCLQNELLSHTLMESNIDIKDVDVGKNTIRLRLCYKKVLVILDDVDQSEQLEALANKRNWFGLGSIIIITTRDERLLIGHRLAKNEICRAKELNNDEALCLFSWKAFEEELPPEEFLELSKKIINHTNGLPLALEVLGSFFGSLLQPEGSVDIWESALSRLKENPDETIMKTLQISFDGLAETEKNIFLEIACFYKGKDSDCVKGRLESCGYHPNIGIKVLISKSLITMRGRKLWMHDLLETMGREIVRCESPNDPGQRSRLWHDEDILRVLKSNSGTEKILGIFLKSPLQEELQLSSDVFSKMKNLRLLKISRNVHLSQGLSYLSSELRAMEWNGYPLKSLPMGFQPNKLVELNMHCSHIVQPWQGIKDYIYFAMAFSVTSRVATIPIWFQNQNRGSSVRLHLDLDDSRKWLGFALYFVFEIHDLESWESTRFGRLDVPLDREDFDQLVFHFDTDEGPLKEPLVQPFAKCPINTPAGYSIYVPRIWFEKKSNEVDTWTYIEVSITIGSPFMKVEMCGARLVSEQNAHEFIDALKFIKKKNLNICDGKWHLKIFRSSPRSSNLRGSLYWFVYLVMPENVGEVEPSGSNLLDKGFISNEILEYTSKEKDRQSLLFRCCEEMRMKL